MNKREPLLSEEMARNIMKNCAYNPGTMNPVSETAAFYERLIDSGKLRVVEECGYVPADTWCSVCICKGCGEACSEAGEKEPYPYCPYCRRKIIKQ